MSTTTTRPTLSGRGMTMSDLVARFARTDPDGVAPREPAEPPTAAEIDGYCREHLASYKRPRDVVLVAALPRNPSGKVLKTALRSEYAAR